jgi:hypothetical protein
MVLVTLSAGLPVDAFYVELLLEEVGDGLPSLFAHFGHQVSQPCIFLLIKIMITSLVQECLINYFADIKESLELYFFYTLASRTFYLSHF